MARFLVEESLPRSLISALHDAGIQAEDVRDVGLRGRPDNEVLRFAASRGLALLTRDVGLGNVLRFPLGSHAGVLVARFPNDVTPPVLNAAVLQTLRTLRDEDIEGTLVVIEPGRLRVRRRT